MEHLKGPYQRWGLRCVVFPCEEMQSQGEGFLGQVIQLVVWLTAWTQLHNLQLPQSITDIPGPDPQQPALLPSLFQLPLLPAPQPTVQSELINEAGPGIMT